jgi:HlyD family secretion protein
MKRVQIQASVAEADIGRIKEGMDVTFTVDAHRNDRFKGKVAQIRLSPTTVQNVVTYTVMIGAENPGGKLLPGMTANCSFEIDNFHDVIKIPNAAPAVHAAGGYDRDGAPPATAAAPGPRDRGAAAPARRQQQQSRVWVQGPAGPVAMQVTADATDGTWTRMTAGDLKEGQEVLIGMIFDGNDPAGRPTRSRRAAAGAAAAGG